MKFTGQLRIKECCLDKLFLELRTGMESQLAALDDRLKMQEKEVEDVMDIVKKRAEIEKRYGRELEGLARQMRGKHKVVYNDDFVVILKITK